jgi:ribose 5-phosphate isomerase B
VLGGALDHLDAVVQPLHRVRAFGYDIGLALGDLVFEQVARDDAQLVIAPRRGAHEDATQFDSVEQRCAGAPAADAQQPQLVRAVGELEGEADVGDELDVEIGHRRGPAEVGGAAGAITEHAQVATHRSAIDRLLLGFELVRIDERFRPYRIAVGVREPRVGVQPIGHLEPGVGGLVGAARASAEVAGEAQVAAIVGPAQHRGRDARELVDRVRSHLGTVSAGSDTVAEGVPSYTRRVRIVIGGDHAGFALKQYLQPVLAGWGHDVTDLGTHSEEPVDYPPYCAAVGRAVVAGDADLGIVIGGSGQGEQIAANKVRGVRAALCLELYTAKYARLHNNANVLSLGGRIVAPTLAEEIVRVFLETPFEGGRHVARLEEIAKIEATEQRPEGSGTWSRPIEIELGEEI